MHRRWTRALIIAAAVALPACVYVPASSYLPMAGTSWNTAQDAENAASLSVSLKLDAIKTASAFQDGTYWQTNQVSVSVLRDHMLLDHKAFAIGALSADKLKLSFENLSEGSVQVVVEVHAPGGALIAEGSEEITLRAGRKRSITLAVVPTRAEPDDDFGGEDPLAPPRPLAHADPNDFFLSQMFDARWNPGAPAWSQNCGPASLAMVLKAYDMIPPLIGTPEDPQEFILKTRRAMMGNEVDALSSLEDLERGAENLGLKHERTYGLESVRTAVMLGKPVIVAGNPVAYGGRFGSDRYSPFDGGHFVLVTGMTGSQVYLNDPLSRQGNIAVTVGEFQRYMGYQDWNVGMTAYR
ncbi:MAG TPA: C39 family peptidase [Pantanalinema sp.]